MLLKTVLIWCAILTSVTHVASAATDDGPGAGGGYGQAHDDDGPGLGGGYGH